MDFIEFLKNAAEEMEEANKETAEREENDFKKASKDIAKKTSTIFRALVTEGFSQTQALELTKVILSINGGK